jgi:hypothetical protein
MYLSWLISVDRTENLLSIRKRVSSRSYDRLVGLAFLQQVLNKCTESEACISRRLLPFVGYYRHSRRQCMMYCKLAHRTYYARLALEGMCFTRGQSKKVRMLSQSASIATRILTRQTSRTLCSKSKLRAARRLQDQHGPRLRSNNCRRYRHLLCLKGEYHECSFYRKRRWGSMIVDAS